jgi:3-methyladenine DNA glycosylase AlkD
MKCSSDEIRKTLRAFSSSKKAKDLQRFFKTDKGEYGEGDVFIGVVVPDTRKVAREFRDADIGSVKGLLHSKVHEERLVALLILVEKFAKGDEKTRTAVFTTYLENTNGVNNWDLVDLSAPRVVGRYLLDKDKSVLYRLAKSSSLWERRIAIISTAAFIDRGQLDDTFAISELLLSDGHDLIHKAVGWMLREAGKRDEKRLKEFLKRNYQRLPRTALRYAIEKFSEPERKKFLNGDF